MAQGKKRVDCVSADSVRGSAYVRHLAMLVLCSIELNVCELMQQQ
jgi:hypothetical protein